MILSEEEKTRLIDAQTCNDCLCWHKHCHAECCKMVFLNISRQEALKKGQYVTIHRKKPLTKDELWYYKLRDVVCTRSSLKFRRERIVNYHGDMVYIHPCSMLNECKCLGPPNSKPNICKKLDYEYSKTNCKDIRVTDNCLYKYKRLVEYDSE